MKIYLQRLLGTSKLFHSPWGVESSLFLLVLLGLVGLTSVDGGEEPNLLSIILADGRSGEMTSEGEKTLVEEGVGSEDEELLQDLEGKGCRWDDSCLARFNKFLG